MAALNAASEGTSGANEVLLTDELIEGAGAHPRGQRLTLGWRLEEGFGSSPARLRPWGRHVAQSTDERVRWRGPDQSSGGSAPRRRRDAPSIWFGTTGQGGYANAS